MRSLYIAFSLILLLLGCTAERKEEGPVITLSNGTVEIKVLADAGGTLVYASLAGHENILNSDSILWNGSSEKSPSMDPASTVKAYNGMIVWLSPQSEWWVKQDQYPELRNNHAQWPPDPYLTSAPYRIITHKDDELTLVGPKSPYTHVQLTKNFRILGNKIYITAFARNCSSDTISWGLWFNTRMNGWDKVMVPGDSADLIKTQYMNPQDLQLPAFKYANGYFSYQATEPMKGQRAYKSKSFISSDNPVIIGNKAKQWLIIRSDRIDPKRIHPEQGRIEIYVENSSDKASDLQELEMHFAYEKIAPGASIQASETWELIPDPGDANNDLKVMLQ
jgi:hypothetical protein